MINNKKYAMLDARYITEIHDAICIEIDYNEPVPKTDEHWIPLSLVRNCNNYRDRVEFEVEEWFAQDKGLI